VEVSAEMEAYLMQNAHRQNPKTLKALLQENELDMLQEQRRLLGVSQ